MRIEGRAALALCLAFTILHRQAQAQPAPESAPRSFPVSLTQGSRLLVDARINSHPVQALLDSAAESSFIDASLARELRLTGDTTVKGQGSGENSFDVKLAKGVQIEAFGLVLKDQTVATADLTDVGQRLLGQRLDVILGREIFDAARLRIDIDGRSVSVMDRGSSPPGVRLDLREEHGIETIPARVEGSEPVRATFDLGNGSEVLVGSGLAARLRLLSDGRPVEVSRGGGLGGETARRVVVLRTLEIAGRVFHDVRAAVDERPSASDLNVGISVLRAFIITSDFAARSVWLEPRPAHSAP